MLKKESVQYINNLAKMFSSFASATGKSVIAVEAYGKKNYMADFVARYGISAENFKLVPTEKTLREVLTVWFSGDGEGKTKDRLLARCFNWQLRRGFGEPKAVFVLGEDRSVLQEFCSDEEGQPRYALEDLLFAVYQEGTLCFLRGRGE